MVRSPFIRQCGKDDQQLGSVCGCRFIHQASAMNSLARLYVPINFCSRLHREQVFPGHLPTYSREISNGWSMPSIDTPPIARVALNERRHRIPLGRLPIKSATSIVKKSEHARYLSPCPC